MFQWSNIPYYQDDIIFSFLEYLSKKGASVKTRKNYKCDLRHFSSWVNIPITQTSQKYIESYKHDLVIKHVPVATINRRLSTLRAFFQFSHETGRTKTNPASAVTGISVQTKHIILEKFRQALLLEGASNGTVKSYMADVKQFLAWYGH